MSMLQAQCDELRSMAASVGLEVPQAATLMMGAADTIWELRDDLQRANDAVREAEHDESVAWDRVRKAEAEADRLRELARDIYGEYRYLRVRFHRTYVQHEERMRAIERRMRELGVD